MAGASAVPHLHLTMTDDYLTRVAIHGSISPDDVPDGIELTNEEADAIVEILYVRSDDEYHVLSRHNQTLYLDHGTGGPYEAFDDALDNAIQTACSDGLPLLKKIYSWVSEENADELGQTESRPRGTASSPVEATTPPFEPNS